VLTEDGREQISGYHMPGDLVGLDGIGRDRYGCQAVALKDGEVCVLPFERLDELARALPLLQHNLYRSLGNEICQNQKHAAPPRQPMCGGARGHVSVEPRRGIS
jgi:CRP/FNR family transcriptional regulator